MLLLNLFKLLSLLSAYLYFLKIHNYESEFIANRIISTIKNGENVFWKLSQWITSRIEFQSHVKNNYLIDNLKVFYENCPSHDFTVTRNSLENHFNKPLEEVFESIREIPEASGSIGQVHIGVLKDGRKVAIKVKHPDIDDNITYLCWILRSILKIRFLMRKINFDITGIEEYLMKQTDFKNEASNLKKLSEFYKDNEYILVPEVYEEGCDILIMEYLEGINIENFYNECIKNNSKDKHWEVMIKFWLFVRESILIHNFFHADLHKGNWKIKEDKIIIYDLGIILDNPEHFEINTKIWKGFECRSPKIISEVITNNLIDNEIEKDKFKNELLEHLSKNMDVQSIDFMGDIKNLLIFLNERKVILNFQTLTYLLAFNLASLNFKNFSFIDDNNRTYFEQHLDRFNLMKQKCKEYNNDKLREQLELDEEFFINENKHILKAINEKKDAIAYEYLSSDSE